MLKKLYLKYLHLKTISKFKSCGSNFKFDPSSSIFTPHLMTIGNNVFIGEKAHISANINIGNNVMFGPKPLIVKM